MPVKNHPKGVFRVWLGLVLVFVGTAFLLEAFEIGDAEWVLRLWPTLAALILLAHAFRPGRRPGLLWPVVIIVAGVLVQLHTLGWLHLRGKIVWPLLLILAGLHLFRSSLKTRPASAGSPGGGEPPREVAEPSAAIEGAPAPADATGAKPDDAPRDASVPLEELVFFSGRDRRFAGHGFRGGTVTAIFGGYNLDLRQAELPPGTVELQATAVFGGVEIRVPESWNVQADGAALLGSIENKTRPPIEEAAPVRLVVRGTALFGGVEIKN